MVAALAAVLTATSSLADNRDITSPDGRVVLTFDNDYGVAFYSVMVDGQYLIHPSRLGIKTANWSYSEAGPANIQTNSFFQHWTQPWGENKECLNHYNEIFARLDGGKMGIRFRVFDDGVAFRYEINSEKDTLIVTDELSQFNFRGDGQSWSIPGNFETYELEYRNLPISQVADANTPFTFVNDAGIYGSIHEAALYDYPEMILRRASDGILTSDLAPLPDGVKAYIPGHFVTPWRTIQIGRKPTDLINSAMILNLNEPSRIEDTSWIKPQKYVGIWWGMHLGTQTWTMGPKHGATTENAIRYIDFAKANNLQGVLFEGWNEGWENWGGNQHFDYMKAYADFDIDSIARYARANGIELWMHDETGGNIPEFEAVLDSAFAYYASLGVHTIKTGYAGGFKGGYFHHSQYGVRHYQRVVETAAKYGIMIDAHEPIKETGIRRTWPNMMTREGARGMEWNGMPGATATRPTISARSPSCACSQARWTTLPAFSTSIMSEPKPTPTALSGTAPTPTAASRPLSPARLPTGSSSIPPCRWLPTRLKTMRATKPSNFSATSMPTAIGRALSMARLANTSLWPAEPATAFSLAPAPTPKRAPSRFPSLSSSRVADIAPRPMSTSPDTPTALTSPTAPSLRPTHSPLPWKPQAVRPSPSYPKTDSDVPAEIHSLPLRSLKIFHPHFAKFSQN